MPKPSKLSGYYLNNSRKSFDHTINQVLDVVEEANRPEKRTEFFALVISGTETTDTTSPGFFDRLFGTIAGIPTAKFKIRFINEDEQRNRYEDPYGSGFSDDIRRRLISLHEDAYFEPTAGITIPPSPGSTVVVRKQNGIYKIIKVIGDASTSGNAKSTKGTKSWFEERAARLNGGYENSSFGGRHVLEKMERKIKPSSNPVIGVGAPDVLPQATEEISFWADKHESQAGLKPNPTDKNHPVYRRVQLMQYYNLQMQRKDKGKSYRKVEEYYPNYVDDEKVKKTYVLMGQDSKTGFMHWSAVSISWIMRGSGFGTSSGHVYYAMSIANGKREGWEVHSLLREKVKILVGDIVIKTRKEKKDDGTYRLDASHGDVIYRISGNTAYTVGGNVDKPGVTGDRGWFGEIRAIALDNEGFLTNPGPYIVVLKKMK